MQQNAKWWYTKNRRTQNTHMLMEMIINLGKVPGKSASGVFLQLPFFTCFLTEKECKNRNSCKARLIQYFSRLSDGSTVKKKKNEKKERRGELRAAREKPRFASERVCRGGSCSCIEYCCVASTLIVRQRCKRSSKPYLRPCVSGHQTISRGRFTSGLNPLFW